MNILDLVYPALGNTLPVDHAYSLYGALARLLPQIHQQDGNIRYCPINGDPVGEGLLSLTRQSRFRLRLEATMVPSAMVLANKLLDISGHKVRIGAPSVSTLASNDRLYSRFVTIKNSVEPDSFLASLRERLREMGIQGETAIPVHLDGPRRGEIHRKVMRISGMAIVGYPVIIDGLSAEDSIRLQSEGVGGRQRIGAGFFLPLRKDQSP